MQRFAAMWEVESSGRQQQLLPIDLESNNTMVNVAQNKAAIDFCCETFDYVDNRIKCIDSLTGGPFLGKQRISPMGIALFHA
mmetsp:Transcript_89613/g.145131  ORF Transcript_89613/g.145131 Transcript_89613/m.145131 type:complete len:82 (+) Transcript_89613:9-254(+)